MNVVIPMAGDGSRFKNQGYEVPKPLIDVFGKPMIQAAVESLDVDGKYIFIIRKSNFSDDQKVKSLLKKVKPGCTIYEIDYLTEGPASTCLLASENINNNEPLLIANCDQIMEWDSKLFLEKVNRTQCDGAVVTYSSNTEKNSYVKIGDEGYATEFAEKKVISEFSLNGIHYWKNGSDFVNSTRDMIHKNIRVNNEFYIAPTYNELILNKKKIIIHHINKNLHHAIGTPEDLKKYEDLQNRRNA